jgi:hypothetical protein
LQKAAPAAMIYANPFDAGHYVREQGYRALVRPREQFDEVVLVCPADAAYQRIEDLQAPLRLAVSHNEDANFIGQRLLEPAGLPENDVERQHKDNFSDGGFCGGARPGRCGDCVGGGVCALERHYPQPS